MLRKFKTAVTSVIVSVGILMGGALIAAPSANAYTDTHWHFQYNCMPYPSGAFQWRDFNWWEEMWGERDRYVWKYNFYRYC